MKKRLLQKILGFITKKIVGKYQPKVVAITGSVGKTSTKNAISLLLKKYFTLWETFGNLNTEFGVPLTFIGKKEGGGSSIWEWIKIIISGIGLILKKKKDYPEVVVVEMGADKPGDISYLTGLVRPSIGVVTMIGKTPVHIENYESLEELTNEKSKIVEVLEKDGYAILNFDDPLIKKMGEKINAKVIYFGFSEGADVRIEDFTTGIKGTSFKCNNQKIYLPYCLGKPFVYSVAASFACGIALGLDLKKAGDIFKDLKPEKGRMNLIKTNDYFILDDSYNASPASTKSALETLRDLPGKRRIAVLGDMKELGEESLQSHKEIGELASQVCDFFITVGDLASEMNASNYKTNKEAVEKIKSILRPGDLILVKGSRSMKMEEIVEEIDDY